jgi:hypothetical protein
VLREATDTQHRERKVDYAQARQYSMNRASASNSQFFYGASMLLDFALFDSYSFQTAETVTIAATAV